MAGELVRLSGVAELMPKQRYLPEVVAQPRVIGTDESVAEGLQRVTTQEFSNAIDALADPDTEIGAAAVAASTNLVRIEAILRLVRPSIGDDACGAELRVIREVRDFLDRSVAGQAEISTLDDLRSRYDAALRPEALSELRDQLLQRHQSMRLELLPAARDGDSLQHWLQQLRRARARFAAWPIDEPMYGRRPVPDSFEAVADGLTRSYRKGRNQAHRDRPKVAKWQRHARDLGHQVELLSGGWPDTMMATGATAGDLAEVLAEHARVSALRTEIAAARGRETSTLVVDEVTAAVVESLCDHERDELMAIASVLATRLYAEEPSAFIARAERYWSTRR